MAAATSAPAAKTERLLNLVIALLWTRRPLTKAQIRQAVPQYRATASMEAFDRMFERDKDELRDLGIPLDTAPVDVLFDDELGYRIDKREYALPAVSFSADEIAALVLAARAWQRATLAGAAASALTKLRAAGVEIDDRSVVGIEPQIRTAETAFDPLRTALTDRREVTFDYRKPDGSSATRRVQPWGLTSWRGRWYLTGFDVDRGAERVFRLSRVVGPVRPRGRVAAYDIPAGHEPRVLVAGQSEPGTGTPAVVEVRDGAGNTLRRRGRVTAAARPGWARVEVTTTDLDRLADEVAGFGPDAVVTGPPALVQAVTRRLAAAVAGHPAPAGEDPDGGVR